MAKDLYRSVTAPVNYYGSSTAGTEADMRNELIYTLDGRLPEVAKGQPGLLRKMRRDSDDKLLPCSCVDSVTREPDKDRFCSFCFGTGFYWDETEISYYRTNLDGDKNRALQDRLTAAGLINVPLVVFYIRYSNTLTPDDRIVLINLEDDGSISSPLQRRAIFKIGDIWDYRADNGKLEYWKAVGYEEKTKYLNAPDYAELNNE